MQTVVPLNRWYWPDYARGHYYGYRHGLVIGRWLFLWGLHDEKEQSK